MNKLAVLFIAVAAVAACGGGGGDEPTAAAPTSPSPTPPSPTPPTPTPPGPGTAAPGGLYVGYYQEDRATNPEDPVPGAFSLNLPAGNASFSGSMFFTYVGCQPSNVGTVGGTKTDAALSGDWSGTVDGLAQSGAYTGSYQATTTSYSGTYTNSAGVKQFRDVSPCITYTIAPNGTWEMFPIEAAVPAEFTVIVSGRAIRWSSTTGAERTLVYVLDPVIAQSSGNPVLWQTIVPRFDNSVSVPDSVGLQTGKEYIAVVGIGDVTSQRIAFGSKRFTP